MTTDDPKAKPLPDFAADDWKACPPRLTKERRPNPEHYRWRLARITDMVMAAIARGERVPFNAETAQSAILNEAKMAGLKASDIMEQRSEAQVTAEAVERLLTAPGAIFEIADQILKTLIAKLDEADAHTQRAAEQAADLAEHQNAGLLGTEVTVADGKISSTRIGKRPKESADPKVWAALLRRVLGVRDRARSAVPKGTANARRHVIAAAQPLRFMLYVGRSQMSDFQPDAGEGQRFFRIGAHHGAMTLAVYLGKHQLEVGPRGKSLQPTFVAGPAYDEVIITMPPGHGKTEFASHFFTLEIAEDPMTQLLCVHAQGDKANKNVGYLASCFKDDTANGRRCRALFPGLELADSNNNAKEMRLKLDVAIKDPTAWAAGMGTMASGGNATKVWFDDPVDQSEIHQAAERARTAQRMEGTFSARARGKKRFTLITATIWHPEDGVNVRIEMARRGEAAIKVLKVPAGGPDSSPPFFPVWEEVYDAAYLRTRFNKMRDPVLYAAMYQCDPRTPASRIIRAVRFYDPKSEEHLRFLKSAVRHLSLDPAATRSATSDDAGVLYGAHGTIERVDQDATRKVTSREDRLRILSAQAFKANQLELAKFAHEFCRSNKVDYVHIEARSGLTATSDFFEDRFKIDVVRHDPKNKGKDQRLRAAAPLIDDSQAAVGIRAVVEFPGHRTPAGELVAHPDIVWVVTQILEFGNTGEDHIVDCLTQLANHLAPELSSDGEGIASVQAHRAPVDRDAEFIRRTYDEWDQQQRRDARRGQYGASADGWADFMSD